MQQNTFFSLEQVIDRQPITVSPKTPLNQVVSLMQEWGNSCDVIARENKADEDTDSRHNNSCVLIVENNRLLGIFTERDLVRLVAVGADTQSVSVGKMMTENLVTIKFTGKEDIFTALSLLKKYAVRHLPVVDENENLVGLVTAKNLRQKLQPINLMKWRKVAEIMETKVSYATPNDSVQSIAVLMAENRISCVAICETNDSVRPIGIITERDIVQFQNLNLDLTLPAHNLMSTPLFLVNPEDSLWNIYQQMKQRRVRRMLVAGDRGELAGIITQSSLLQVFDPTEMYGTIEVLQRQVCQLEDEREKLLQQRNQELEQEAQDRAAVITAQNQELSFYLNNSPLAVVEWDRHFRVKRWSQRAEQMFGWQAAEVIGKHWQDWQFVLNDDSQDVLDIASRLLNGEELRNVSLNRNYTKDGSIVDCEWHNSVLLDDSGNPMSILSLAQDISDRQNALRDRALAEASLIESQKRYTLAVTGSSSGLWDWNMVNNEVFYAPRWREILECGERDLSNTFEAWSNRLHPQERERVLSALQEHLENHVPFDIECRLRKHNGDYCWVQAKGQAIWDESGKPVRMAGSIIDISDRKQAELELKQSEQKFKAIFDQSFQFIGLLEPNGKLIEANRTSLDFIGLTSADVKGKLFWETPWWSGSLKAQELLKQGIERAAKGDFVRFEVEHPGIENRFVTVDFSLTPIKDETGKVIMLIPEGRNISDRKKAEAELAKSNRVLQAISSLQTQYLTDANPRILFDGMLANLLELTQSEYGFVGEINFATDGSPVMKEGYMKTRGRPYLKTHAITNIAWNDETRAFYAENAPKGMEFHNLETLFGAVIVTGEPVIANNPSTDSRGGGIPKGHPNLNAFLGIPFYKNNKMTGMVGIANRKGGYNRTIVEYLRPLLDTCSRVIEAYKSDKQKRQAEAKISEQAALLDIANDAIMVRDAADRILFWNRGAEKLYGWSKAEVLNRNAKELFNQKSTVELSKIHQAVKERGEWQGELNQVTKANREIVVQSRWTLVKDETEDSQTYLVVKTDITEQKQLEVQFLRTQRLESLGTLAGGIAHDLNNILAPILGFAKLLPLKLPDVDEQTKGFFKIIENNANRGTALVKQILTFSRGLEGDKGTVQIRHLIAEIGQIIQETFPKSIELQIHAPKTLWTVKADVNQLHQVLMNLAVNARDAMPDGGKLTIDAHNTTVDAEYARLHLEAKQGSYLAITVSDTGVGISSEVIDRIFEPFFTTKEVGHGTGLGLSTVIGIIKSHDGFVDVVSNKNPLTHGTQFKVFLPACDLAVTEHSQTEAIPYGNGELILVVDDETAILEVTQATLETYNYKVMTASNGMDAIAVYARNRQNIQAVIMDIMMPTMDGKTAIRTLKKINPEVKIIAVSGLINRQEIVGIDGEIAAYLAKPYNSEDLLKIINDLVGN